MNSSFSKLGYGLGGMSLVPEKRKIFISFHHDEDQRYYDQLSSEINNEFVPVKDNSLDRAVDSDNPDYVMQRIRDKNITGTSCTVVLCGKETQNRKYVDWEIKGTLDKRHGLIGIILPTCSLTYDNKYIVHKRLYDNLISNYALLLTWSELFPQKTFPIHSALSLQRQLGTLGSINPPDLHSTLGTLGSINSAYSLSRRGGYLLKEYIDNAVLKSTELIKNDRDKMRRNGVPT